MKPALLPIMAALALSAAAGPPAARAAAPPPAALSAEDQALVKKATSYIESLKSVQGRFTQTSSRGGTSAGTFSMQRPGKARFEYDPPADMLIVSDGYNVKVFDRRLKTFDQYPLGQTPLVILLAREVRLDRGVVVTGVTRTEHGFSITARDAKKQADGSITIDFADQPMALKGWTVHDAQGVETHVALGPLNTAVKLDPKLFELSNPKAHAGPR